MDPIISKRAGLSVALINAWPEIVGAKIADNSHPLKINWPTKKPGEDTFEPGTLIVAASGIGALHIQHQSSEVIARVNAFMGFAAIDKMRISQRAPISRPVEKVMPKLDANEQAALEMRLPHFEDNALAEAIRRFGENVLREKKAKK